MTDFATKANVKEFLGITGTSDDDLIDNILARTTQIIKNYTRRNNLLSGSVTELISGDGMIRELVLQEYPVSAISSVYDDLDREFGSGTLLVEGTDYKLVDEDDPGSENPGIILRLDGNVWTKGDKNIKVVYTAGYSSAPADLVHAQILFSSYIYQQKASNLGIKGYRLGQFSVTYDDGGNSGGAGYGRSIPIEVRDILDFYKSIGIASTEDQTGV